MGILGFAGDRLKNQVGNPGIAWLFSQGAVCLGFGDAPGISYATGCAVLVTDVSAAESLKGSRICALWKKCVCLRLRKGELRPLSLTLIFHEIKVLCEEAWISHSFTSFSGFLLQALVNNALSYAACKGLIGTTQLSIYYSLVGDYSQEQEVCAVR